MYRLSYELNGKRNSIRVTNDKLLAAQMQLVGAGAKDITAIKLSEKPYKFCITQFQDGRLVNENGSVTFVYCEYANGNYIERRDNGLFMQRWAVPANQEPVAYFADIVLQLNHGLSWN